MAVIDDIGEDSISNRFVKELTMALKATGLDVGVIHIISQNDTVTYSYGMGKEQAESIWTIPVNGTTLTAWIREQGVFVTDDRSKDEFLNHIHSIPLSVALSTFELSEGITAVALMGKNEAGFGLEKRRPMLELFANQLINLIRSEQDKQELIRRNEELQTLYETSQVLATSLERDEVLNIIAKRAAMMVGADNCLILQAHKRERVLQCVAIYSAEEQLDPRTLSLRYGEGLTGLVAETGEGMLIKRADMDSRSKLVEGTEDEPSSVISIPLKLGEDLLGVMTLEKTPGLPFDEQEYRLVEMFSLQAVLAFKNANLFHSMKALLQSQQMYNVLLTHDVANYNVPIHGYLEMLVKDPKLDERERRYVRSALAQSENISSLISDVRRLWWLRSGGAESKFKPIDLVQVVRELIDGLNCHILYGNRQITMDAQGEEAWVEADIFLKDVLYNIVSNACKYGETGPVVVRLRPETMEGAGYWRVEVEDHGKGIPDERKESLFKRFDMIDSDIASEGHGLGLSVVSAFVSHYRGKAWAENRVEGDWTQGSIFIVRLPKINKQS
ncbi:MAG: sensory histidine kinase CreC [Methanomassiliicoccales archaeon PtaU1.Bin124]|nr:MAG: sensory histidine kinase CreC [Methanomassiliicoccales archaeon PtaU1.Bin124]